MGVFSNYLQKHSRNQFQIQKISNTPNNTAKKKCINKKTPTSFFFHHYPPPPPSTSATAITPPFSTAATTLSLLFSPLSHFPSLLLSPPPLFLPFAPQHMHRRVTAVEQGEGMVMGYFKQIFKKCPKNLKITPKYIPKITKFKRTI